MRAGFRRATREEEEESVFVSMTDMTVSFLFIIMILLAFFISKFSESDTVPRDQFEQMRDQRDALIIERNQLERNLATALEERDEARAQRDDLQNQLNLANSHVKELEAENFDLRRLIEKLKIEIAAQEETIERLETKIANLERQLRELKRRDPLEAYLTRAAAARLKILEELRDRIRVDFPDLQIEISAESDALRFQGEGLFDVGRSNLKERPRQIVETIAERLNELLPCYTLGSASGFGTGCNPSAALIEAIQIEGHTDNQGSDLSNLRLSTDRANATFSAMLSHRSDLIDHLNYREQPVMSVAGYGEMRPFASNETPNGRSANRRIDLRIIMYTPIESTEIEKIKARLTATDGETKQ